MIILASQLLSHRLYLDPGSGSALLQIVLAALFSVGVIIRLRWAQIKSFFKGKNADVAEDESDNEE